MSNSELTVANSDDARICGCVTMRTRVWTRVAVLRPWDGVGNARDTGSLTLWSNSGPSGNFGIDSEKQVQNKFITLKLWLVLFAVSEKCYELATLINFF